MNQTDTDQIRADIARLNKSLNVTVGNSFHADMMRMRKAHEDSLASMRDSMDEMRKAFDQVRTGYQRTPEYRRQNDELTARMQFLYVPIFLVGLFAVVVAVAKVVG